MSELEATLEEVLRHLEKDDAEGAAAAVGRMRLVAVPDQDLPRVRALQRRCELEADRLAERITQSLRTASVSARATAAYR